jgi:predicted amidohydrolase YtcJ
MLAAQLPLQVRSADLALINGRVFTPEGWVHGLAIAGNAIIGLGDEEDLRPHLTDRTRVIDLAGNTVLPGFFDMHVHPTGAGLAEMQCRLPHGSSPEAIFAITEVYARKRKPGEWITGRAYEAASFGDTPPHKSMLDAIAPDNPIYFQDISGHSGWANSLALQLAGITRDTPDPPNGIIERDLDGEPTGLLRERAAWMLMSHVPPPTREETSRGLKWALDTMLAQGITSLDDAGVGEAVAQAYADLADRGELRQRVRGCLMYSEPGLISRRALYARERFSPSCVKMVLDGVPTDSHTAAMFDEYLPTPGRNDPGRVKGMLMIEQEDLNVLVTHFDLMGLTVKFHAAGDAAVHAALNAIEAARQANGHSGLLHNPGHNSFVQMSDIPRVRALGAAIEFSPYIWFRSPIIDDIEKAVKPELMERWIPIKDALDAGALAVPGSDWAVVPSVNPWIALEAMVTRQMPGGVGEPLGEQERITLRQAVDMFTINSARQAYAADRLGSIEIGKVADLIVIDRNIFEVPITTVHQTQVLMTIIDGEITHDPSGL